MELTKNDIHNLLIFLQRTTIQGLEVPAYCQLVSKLETMQNNTPEEIPKEVQEK